MDHGGKREGAGRPVGSRASHTIEAEALRKYLVEQVVKNKEAIIASLIKQAQEGNIPAIKELLDRVFGKSNALVELTSTIQQEQINEISEQVREWIEEARKKQRP